MSIKRIFLIFALLSFTLVCETPLSDCLSNRVNTWQTQSAKANLNRLHQLQVDSLAKGNIEQAFRSVSGSYFTEKEIFSFLYVNGSLNQWNANQVAIPQQQDKLFRLNKIWVKLGDGWYVAHSRESNDTLLLSLLLVQKEYSINNTFFKQKSNPNISANQLKLASFAAPMLADNIVGINWDIAPKALISLLLYLALLLCLITFFSESWQRFIMVSLCEAVRMFILSKEYQFAFTDLPLFNPDHYGYSKIMPSLGEWLINIGLFIWWLKLALPYLDLFKNKLTKCFEGFGFLVLLLSPLVLIFSTQNLTFHATHQFYVENMLQMDAYVWLVIIGLVLLGLTLFDFCFQTLSRLTNPYLVLLASTTVGVAFAYVHWEGLLPALVLAIFNGSVGLYLFLDSKKVFVNSILKAGFYGIALGLFFSASFYYFYNQKNNDDVKLISDHLISGRDYVQEYLFKKSATKLATDRQLKNRLAVFPESQSELSEQLANFFSGQWNGFAIKYFLFSDTTLVLQSTPDIAQYSKQELDNIIAESEPCFANGLWLAPSTTPFLYVSKTEITLGRANSNQRFGLYYTFSPSSGASSLGYPELLLEAKKNMLKSSEKYTYKIYRNGVLTSKSENHSFKNENSNTLVKQSADGRTIVYISKLANSFFGYLNTFFVFFVSLLIFGLLMTLPFGEMKKMKLVSGGLRVRIMLNTAGLISIALLIIGFATSKLIIRQFEHKNKDLAHEKLAGIRYRLQHLNNDVTPLQLQKLAEEFQTDINLFNQNGNLLQASRPEIFKEGFLGEMLPPNVLSHYKSDPEGDFSQNESIGELSFLSVYASFNFSGNNVILNVPFFARQGEFKAEFSDMISSLISVFFFLVTLSLILMYVISGNITSPLETMANKLADFSLQNPQYIEWDRDDEVGKVVKSYNLMVEELTRSAAELARSEREFAWREMAKQVAHEIKNPLTPMKLQVQHLLMRYKARSEGWELQLEKTLPLLEEQINSLAEIATSFSDFAKMPHGRPENFEIQPMLLKISALYSPSLDYELTCNLTQTPIYVYADKEQLSRCIQNLVKNATQAIPQNRKGKIEIDLSETEDDVSISVSDNGVGITAENNDSIFVPNFTTKNSGMGLGLAIVKNIVEQAKGTIAFKTTLGEGTTFTIKLPKA